MGPCRDPGRRGQAFTEEEVKAGCKFWGKSVGVSPLRAAGFLDTRPAQRGGLSTGSGVHPRGPPGPHPLNSWLLRGLVLDLSAIESLPWGARHTWKSTTSFQTAIRVFYCVWPHAPVTPDLLCRARCVFPGKAKSRGGAGMQLRAVTSPQRAPSRTRGSGRAPFRANLSYGKEQLCTRGTPAQFHA